LKRRVCCLLLGICILCLPAQQVYAAPAGPATKAEEKKPHEKEHEKPIPPHEKEHEKPVPPHEKEHPKPHEVKRPHEEKKGPLGEKPEPPKPGEKLVPPHEKEKQEAEEKQPENTPGETPKPTAIPTPAVVQTTTQTTIQSTTSTSTSTLAGEVVKYALQFVGNPYKYGGTSLTNGADCSGFVQSVYKHFNYSIARTSREQAASAGYMEVALKESELQPGDLIFYAKGNGVVYHVALYIGDGKVVHAANSKAGIIISEYTYMKPYKARRIIR